MSIRKDVTVKITNNNATLDMPLQIYELDHGIELRFKLMDYKYKYTKDPQNILNSSDEDILEAYTTIINPRGYELQQINGEVKDDIVIFMIDSSYTDEIDEIGTYSLQIHIKCACSEFSIPPIQFEVLQRLKGIKVVTDGEDSIDDSALIDNYSNFISDETGKLLIEWKKGDIISSVKLNAMVEVINNAVDEEVQRQLNEAKREQQELERQNSVREALNSVDNRVDEAMIEYETRFNALTVSQQQDMEVIDARDGEVSLKARLDRDLINPLQVYEDVEGPYISCDSVEGYAQNVEILGNTIQNQNDLADIRSVGDKLENQELYEIPVLSAGKNLYNENKMVVGMISQSTGEIDYAQQMYLSYEYYIKVKPSTTYVVNKSNAINVVFYYDKDKKYIGNEVNKTPFITPSNCEFMRFRIESTVLPKEFQLEEGTVATSYEPYQGQQITILSPTPLEKVGDVADRIICKDGVWGVEKKIVAKVLNGSEAWARNNSWTSSDYSRFHMSNFDTISGNILKVISDKFVGVLYSDMDNREYEIVSSYNNGLELIIHISNSKLSTVDSQGFKKWLKENPTTVKYQTTQPTFIPLPYDQQIKLRTFANKTNISFGCEIEPTLKASVPKSIGATVNSHTEQIDNLGKELDKVKKLEESTVSTVTTESDFTTVEETSNGYFEDVKIEGRTLVNLCGDFTGKNSPAIDIKDNIVTFNEFEGARFILYDTSLLKPNTTYTLIMLGINIQAGIACDLYPDNFQELGKVGTDYPINVRKFTTPNDISSLIGIRYYVGNGVTAPSTLYSPIILEGDHTQNPPEFFEGIKSVGQDVDEISVLSCNENLFDKSQYLPCGLSLDEMIFNPNYRTYYTKCEPNTSYYIRSNCSGNRFAVASASIIQYDTDFYINKKHNSGSPDNEYNDEYTIFTTGQNDIYLFVYVTNNGVFIDKPIIHIEKSSVIEEYKNPQQDKKRILYCNPTTNTWEKPVLREWDTIEKHSDGKYYYHKRSGEVVLDGSENWRIRPDVTDDGAHAIFSVFTSFKYNKSSYMICDKFNPKSVGNANEAYSKGEGITYYNYSSGSEYAIYYVISKSKLSSQDVAGFTAWLQANPTTIVYQLEKEEVYECTSIDLMTYKNETNYIVTAGAIAPVSTLKVMCNINNVVRELQQKVSNLENYIQHVMIDALNNALNE